MRLWWHRRTLVDLLLADVSRSDDLGPDWPEVVMVSCWRQDLGWLPESEEPQARVTDVTLMASTDEDLAVWMSWSRGGE